MSSAADLTTAGWISAGDDDCYIGITTSYYVSEPKSLLISAWDGGDSSDSEIAALPVLSQAINGLQITLSYRQRTGGTVQVGYITDVNDASTFVLVKSLASSTSSFTTTTVDLSTVPATAARIAIKQYTWYDCYIDDIVVETLPTCFIPTALAATLTPGDGTVATLSWTKGGEETNWVLQYGTDSEFNTFETYDGEFTIEGTTISADLMSLTPETTYYARVKSDCGGGDLSTWSSVCTFKPTDTSYTLVYDGTPQTTNSYVPMYGYYNGYYQKGEIVYPATTLTELNGKMINELKFYTNSTSTVNFGTGYVVFMKEVDETSISAFSGYTDDDVVYEGTLGVANKEMTIALDNSYEYKGGNLLIGIYHTTYTSSNWTSTSWYGQTVNGASVQNYGSSSLASLTATQRNFIPKTQFGHMPNPYPMPTGLAYDNVDPQHTTLSWTAPISENTITGYSYQYKPTAVTDWSDATTTTNTSVSLTLSAETEYDFRVKALYEEDHESSFAKISWTTLAACMAPENLEISDITWNSATFNWTEGFGNGQWKLGYKETTETTYTYVDVVLADLPLTLDVFAEQTTYDVVVYPLCDETKTIEDSFTTQCAPISVGKEWKENFDSYTGSTISTSTSTPTGYPNVVMPDCWDWLNRSTTSSTYPQLFLSSSTVYAVSGNCLFFRSSHTTPIYVTLPTFSDNLSTLQITFTYRNENTGGSNGTLYVGYMTDPKNANTFTPVYTCPQVTTKTEKTVELTSAPSTGHIAFKYIGAGDYDNYYLSIDNVVVEPIPSCRRPSDLTKSNVTNHSATLAWTNGEEGQDAWQIAYSTVSTFAPADDFTPGENEWLVDVDANPYTFNKTLNAATTYYMYVRANCDDDSYSKWSKTVCSFTTGAAWPAPTTFTASNVTKNSVDLVWNSNGGDFLSGWDLYYVKSETAPEAPTAETPATKTVTTLPTTGTPCQVTGLDSESRYYFWVRANHEEATHSTWKALTGSYITTLVACQVPTGLAVSEIQLSSAKVTWNGDASSYNLRYRSTDAPTNATITLNVPGDVWDDGSGYQMVLDADATMYGNVYDGDNEVYLIADYSDFEYLIPTNAVFDPDATSIVFENSVTIQIPAGTYDWYIFNPSPGEEVYMASENGNVGGGQDDYVFEAGKTYVFTVENNGSGEEINVSITGGGAKDEPKESAWIVIEDITSPYTIHGLTEETNYEVQVQAVCGGADGESLWSTSYNFATPSACDKPINLAVSATHKSASLCWTGYQTNYNVQYRNAEIPSHQETILFEDFENGIPDTWTILTLGTSPNTDGWVTTSNGGSNVAVSYSYLYPDNYNANNYLITPRINLQGSLKFKVKDNSDSTYPDEFEVLLSTTGTAAADFTITLREMQSPTTTMTEISPIDLSDYAGQQGYIAIHHQSSGNYYIMVDDFGIYGAEIPTVPAGEWISRNNVTSPCEITGLTVDTDYEWKVQGNCQGATTTEWSEGVFTTLDANTKVFTTAGYWNDATNWMDEMIGNDLTDNVILRANATIESTCVAQANSITKEGTSTPTLTVKDGGQLICNNPVTATVEKDIEGYTIESAQEHGQTDGWYFIASPLSTAFAPTSTMLSNNYDLFRLDPTENLWENYKEHEDNVSAGFSLTNGRGYLYANSEDVTLQFTGAIKPFAASEDVAVSAGWNLIGNPFTYAVYANQDYYMMNEDHTNFEAVDKNTVTIMPCTGIVVEAAASGAVTFSKEKQVSSVNHGNIQMALAQTVATRNGHNMKTIDNVIVSFNEGSKLSKFYFGQQNANIYIPQDNAEYAIVSAEAQGETPVCFQAYQDGQYTITINTNDVEMAYLHLIDNLAGKDVDLIANPSYTFDAIVSEYPSRFRLVFSANMIANDSDSENFAFMSNGSLIIANEGEATLQVIDVNGRILSSETINGSFRKTFNAKTGVYVLRLINGNEVKTQKIIVK